MHVQAFSLLILSFDRSKKVQRGKRSRFIDDAAEESDDQGGTRENDDEDEDDEDDEEEDDIKRPGRKKARSKFIVDDDVEEEDAGVKKEKITITEREKRLDAADYELIAENTGLSIRPEDYDDDDDDEDEDDGDQQQPARRRVHQSGKVRRDDDNEVEKTTKKRFNQYLADAPADADRNPVENEQDYDSDSDNSMKGFIEEDIEDEQDPGRRQRNRRRDPLQPSAQKMDVAYQLFNDDRFSDEDEQEKPEDQSAAEQTKYDTFEPNQVIENFLTREDIRIRETDEPERLQIDLKGRFPVRSVEDLRAEADWMLSQHRWKTSDLMSDTGDAMEEFVHPETKQRTNMSKTERSQLLQGRLIEKIVNVLCYLRGVENESILHGPITIDDVDQGGPKMLEDSDEVKEAEWEYVGSDDPDFHGFKRRITAKLDVPFILRYRQEYWRDELRPSDIWKIYDLDGKWSAFRIRQEALISKLKAAGDDDAADKAMAATGEEALNDVTALYELRHVRADHEPEEDKARRKMPVRVTKYQQCEQANLNELVLSFCMTPAQLAENLHLSDEGSSRSHEPPTPATDPITAGAEAVEAAERFGFRDVDSVLRGARFMAAKQLATEPGLRDYVRGQFAQKAQVLLSMTKKGKDSQQIHLRPLIQLDQVVLHALMSMPCLCHLRAGFKACALSALLACTCNENR
jgi:transcription elongation factor SPT6